MKLNYFAPLLEKEQLTPLDCLLTASNEGYEIDPFDPEFSM